MPSVGLGLWKVGKDVCTDTVLSAIKAGYRLLDAGADYGNEQQVGDAITQAIKEGLVQRKDLFVASKLWNTEHRKENVRNACLRTLKDLQVEYLDLYLIHFPISLKHVPHETRYPAEWIYDPSAKHPQMEEDLVPLSETWAAMEALVDEGLVRNIGLCNMKTQLIRDILSYARIRPAALQVEIHPFNTQEKLLRFCRQSGIAVTAFSSFGGFSYVELGMATKEDSVLTTSVIEAISKAHGRTPGQIALRWAVQRGTAIIPKTLSPARLAENIGVFDFNLTDAEMKAIDGLNKN
jgi:D-xylose reductase